MPPDDSAYRILFVCTGNIFRSLTADVALQKALAGISGFHVSSAGTDDYPHIVRPYTAGYLRSKGFDVSSHQRRTLTDVIPDYRTNRAAVEAHVRSTINRIVKLAPRMATNLDALRQKYP